MALIAALVPDAAERAAFTAATADHRWLWANDWRDLIRVVKKESAIAAVADLHAEPGKDGALRVLRFSRRYPRTPLVIWGELDGRDLFRLGKAGAFDVILAPDTGNSGLLAERIAEATVDHVARRVDEALRPRIGTDGRSLVQSAAQGIPEGIQVPTLAALHGFSVSTLERRCQDWGLTTPGRILLWLRIIYGLNWLLEPGRSVESVAAQIGYSSGAAFRRAVKVTLANGARGMRAPQGLEHAVSGFADDCPGDPTLATAGAA